MVSAVTNCTDPALFSSSASAASLERKYACASLWAASALLRVGGHGSEPQSHDERVVLIVALALAAAGGIPYLIARAEMIRSTLAAAARPAAAAGPPGLYLRDRLAPPPRQTHWAAPRGGAPAGPDWWQRVSEYSARHAAAAAARRSTGEGLAGDLYVLQAGGLTAAQRVRAFLQVRTQRVRTLLLYPPISAPPRGYSQRGRGGRERRTEGERDAQREREMERCGGYGDRGVWGQGRGRKGDGASCP
jgi:hypothetical protein